MSHSSVCLLASLPTKLGFSLKDSETFWMSNVLHLECAISQQVPLPNVRRALTVVFTLQRWNWGSEKAGWRSSGAWSPSDQGVIFAALSMGSQTGYTAMTVILKLFCLFLEGISCTWHKTSKGARGTSEKWVPSLSCSPMSRFFLLEAILSSASCLFYQK